MALKATIFKARLQVADLDRDHYGDYPLTIARHPSETDERMMVRLLAFAHNAGTALEFTRGLSSDDEADLWQVEPNGDISRWIEVGLPAADRLRKACHRAGEVMVYSYGRRTADVWWQKQAQALARFANLRVFQLDPGQTGELALLARRTMELNITIQDGHLWFADGESSLEVVPQQLQ